MAIHVIMCIERKQSGRLKFYSGNKEFPVNFQNKAHNLFYFYVIKRFWKVQPMFVGVLSHCTL